MYPSTKLGPLRGERAEPFFLVIYLPALTGEEWRSWIPS